MIRLHPQPMVVRDGEARVSAVLEHPDGRLHDLWLTAPADYAPWIEAQRADALVLAVVFRAMRAGDDLRVHGRVSASLLRNLSEVVRVFAAWRPKVYAAVDVSAEEERDDPPPAARAGAVTGLSGGVDSSFTTWRHLSGRAGRWSRPLAAAVVVHGFDVPLSDKDVYERVYARQAAWIAEISGGAVPAVRVATNLRSLGPDWTDACGAGVAAVLTMFSRGAREGLIAGETTYAHLVLPDGVNPITDHLLGSHAFPIAHDGAAFERHDKLRALADAPGGLAWLRVCWEGPALDANCGRCEKCVRTILAARVAGLPLPACFERDPSEGDIRALIERLRARHPLERRDLRRVFQLARRAGIQESWVDLFPEDE